MKCRKCGMEIPSGNKFCPNCGEKVEEIINNESAIINSNLNTNYNNQANMNNEYTNYSNQTNMNNEYTNYSNQTNMNNNYTNKSKSNTGKILIISLVFILLLAGTLFLIFGVFNKDKHDFNTNLKNLDHAMSNMVDDFNNSGTVKVSIEANGSNLNLNMSSYFKYAKTNNGYDFQLGVDKSLFMDEVNAYVRLTNDDITAYFPSNIFDLLSGSYSSDSSYLKYNLKFSDLGDYSLDSIIDEVKNIEQEKVNFKDLLTENNFKYIGKEDNLDHYQLILDETFYKNLYSKIDDFDLDEEYLNQINFQNYNIDIYLNSNDNLEKIVLDLSNFMGTNEFDKLLVTIEFKDLNNTIISIPQEVIKSAKDINDYYKNSWDSLYDYDDSYDFDSILDSDYNLTF